MKEVQLDGLGMGGEFSGIPLLLIGWQWTEEGGAGVGEGTPVCFGGCENVLWSTCGERRMLRLDGRLMMSSLIKQR